MGKLLGTSHLAGSELVPGLNKDMYAVEIPLVVEVLPVDEVLSSLKLAKNSDWSVTYYLNGPIAFYRNTITEVHAELLHDI